MSDRIKDECGEGNRVADRRYSKGVRESVAATSHDERAEKADRLGGDELEAARKAEKEAGKRARS